MDSSVTLTAPSTGVALVGSGGIILREEGPTADREVEAEIRP